MKAGVGLLVGLAILSGCAEIDEPAAPVIDHEAVYRTLAQGAVDKATKASGVGQLAYKDFQNRRLSEGGYVQIVEQLAAELREENARLNSTLAPKQYEKTHEKLRAAFLAETWFFQKQADCYRYDYRNYCDEAKAYGLEAARLLGEVSQDIRE